MKDWIVAPTGRRAQWVRGTLALSALITQFWTGGIFPSADGSRRRADERFLSRAVARGRLCALALLLLLPAAAMHGCGSDAHMAPIAVVQP